MKYANNEPRIYRAPAPEAVEEPLPPGLRWRDLDPTTLADDLRFRLFEVRTVRADTERQYRENPTEGMRNLLFKVLNLEQRTVIAFESAKRSAAMGWSTDKHADSYGLSLNQILHLFDTTGPKP